ncbi:phage tail tape measure protein [Oceanospirillaceae bacterium ASx5O]|nr:phage tail tape measure protein [Oceanospirillaceae bacterium ASx5O]
MSKTVMEKLMVTIGITDQMAGPAASINKTIAGMKQNATAGFGAITGGALGLAGAGMAIKEFMAPVYDMQRALGEVRSLGTAEKELARLEKTALGFSVKYGESAAGFVRSSYDIQSAIGGLVDGELAKFTEASNILAKGTKADAGTITAYMGTMYGIFQDQAIKMGKAEWVQMLTGQTAEAVRMFKTSGAEMSTAFTSLGANAQSAGIGMVEQMAVLGTLQATMSGSEAGTKYKSFLNGVAQAQEKLGISFTDSQGKMLPMLDILQRLKGRFGETLDVAEGAELKQAFGSDEAVGLVKLLMGQTEGLGKSIADIGMIKGMDNAAKMAQTMVDPWEQFGSVTEALRIKIGGALLPTINGLLGKMSEGLTVVMGWTAEFPNITKLVGLLALGILGLGAAVGLVSILSGIGSLFMSAFGGAMLLVKVLAFGLTAGLVILKLALLAVGAVMAFLLSPIGLIVLAVGAVIYLIGDWLGWWDKLKDSVGNIDWLQKILGWLGKVGDAIKKAMKWLGLGGDISADVTASSSMTTSAVMPEMPALQPQESFSMLDDVRKPDATLPSASDSLAAAMGSKGGPTITGNNFTFQNPWRPSDAENWAELQAG